MTEQHHRDEARLGLRVSVREFVNIAAPRQWKEETEMGDGSGMKETPPVPKKTFHCLVFLVEICLWHLVEILFHFQVICCFVRRHSCFNRSL